MRIVEVKIFRVDLPLAQPFQHSSSGNITTLQEVVAAIRTDTGIVGYGELRSNCFYITGDTPDGVVAGASFLASILIGKPLDEFVSLIRCMEKAIVNNSGGKALLDIALHDAYAKALGIPVFVLLGGRVRGSLPTEISIAFAPPVESALQARSAVREGYPVIKVRVGLGKEKDNSRMTAIREAIDDEPLGQDVILSADANGAWSPMQAIRALRDWEKYNLAFIEQPVVAHDINGLRFVRENVGIPVMADESAQGPGDVFRLIEYHAVDLLHFTLPEAGGFVQLRKNTALAEAAGIEYMIGGMDEGMLASAAAAHAGAASKAIYFEVYGDKRVASQPFQGLKVQNGAMIVPDCPGLGVDVYEDHLELIRVIR